MRPTLVMCRRGSQRDVQAKSGVNVGTISKYERGIEVPKPENAERLAPFYNMKPEEFRALALAEFRKRKAAEADRKTKAATAAS